MPHVTGLPVRKTRPAEAPSTHNSRVNDALTIARERGLLTGSRTLILRGRMPSALVEEAKKRTGIQSDSRFVEAALASIVAADDYGAWLLAHRGTVSSDIDLEF